VLAVCVPSIREVVAVDGDVVRGVDDTPDADQPARTSVADAFESRLGDGTDEFEVLAEVRGQLEPFFGTLGHLVDRGVDRKRVAVQRESDPARLRELVEGSSEPVEESIIAVASSASASPSATRGTNRNRSFARSTDVGSPRSNSRSAAADRPH